MIDTFGFLDLDGPSFESLQVRRAERSERMNTPILFELIRALRFSQLSGPRAGGQAAEGEIDACLIQPRAQSRIKNGS